MMEFQVPARYALEGADPVLGMGGMGHVLRARDTVLDLPVALKLIRPEFAQNARFVSRFEQEVRMAARFAHPHIVPLHDLGTSPDGAPYLALALADGGHLGGWRASQQDWPTLKRLTLELLEALAYIHARGVLHRDLKPENVLLHGRLGHPSVWLADLGLANALQSMAKGRGKREGTPGYMAPEQRLKLVREVGPWSDLFSVGVILWELVTGRLPFSGSAVPETSALPDFRPRRPVPDGLALVLRNLLASDPLSRYDLAADVMTELRALPTLDDLVPAGMEGQETVALLAPRPSGRSVSSWVTSALEASSSDTTGEVSSAQSGDFDVGIPSWNRPTPGPMPASPPEEPGRGAVARASLELFAMREVPLVAREDVRKLLWDAARDVAERRTTRVLLVVGEAGSGKTALVESVLHALEGGGWAEPVRLRWHDPPGVEDGYAGAARGLIRPWNETRGSLVRRLVRRLARRRGCAGRAVQEEAVALARWCGFLQPGEEPVAAGQGLREVYREVDARSWRALSVLSLDDAHLGHEDGDGLDIASGALQLLEEGIDRPVLVLATLRSEALAQDASLASRVGDLVAAGAERVDLARLDRAGTKLLLAESLALDPALAGAVSERCAGNPLFARQLLLEWSSRGWLEDRGGLRFGLVDGVDLDAALPADVEALFQHRVVALARTSGSPDAFLLAVHSLALAGAEFALDLFHLVVNDPTMASHLLGCGLLHQRERSVSFDHGLLHASLSAHAASRDDIRDIHGRLADAWLHHGRVSGQVTSFEVGRHLHQAGLWDRAVVPLIIAAERAFRERSGVRLQQASALALDAASRGANEVLGIAHFWAGRAAQHLGDNKGAAQAFELALPDLDEGNDEGLYIDALVGLGGALRDAGGLQQAEKQLTRALNWARMAGSVRGEAEALGALAWLEQRKRNFEGADLLFTRVLNRSLKIDDPRGAADATLGQAYLARRTGRFVDAEELYEEATDTYFGADDPYGVARAQVGLGMVKRQSLDLPTAEILFREAAQTSDELGATPLVMEARMGLADLHRMRGEYDRARSVYTSCARWAERHHAFEMLILARLGLAHLALLEDDLPAMYQHSRDAADHLSQVPGHWLWASYRLTVAVLLALRGDEAETYRWLWSASELGLGDTVDQDTAYLLTVLAHTAADQGWVQPTRIATTFAVQQWKRLGRQREAARVAKALEKLVAA